MFSSRGHSENSRLLWSTRSPARVGEEVLPHRATTTGLAKEDAAISLRNRATVASCSRGMRARVHERVCCCVSAAHGRDFRHPRCIRTLIGTSSGPSQQAPAAPVADIMEALKKSLQAARKPPARAEEVTAQSKPERSTKRQAKKR